MHNFNCNFFTFTFSLVQWEYSFVIEKFFGFGFRVSRRVAFTFYRPSFQWTLDIKKWSRRYICILFENEWIISIFFFSFHETQLSERRITLECPSTVSPKENQIKKYWIIYWKIRDMIKDSYLQLTVSRYYHSINPTPISQQSYAFLLFTIANINLFWFCSWINASLVSRQG